VLEICLMLLALCSRLPDNALVAAECQRLTGGTPDARGVAECLQVDLIERAAYVHTGLRLLAQARSVAELCQQLNERRFIADGFRVEFVRLSAGNPARQRETVLSVADAIEGAPNLETPQSRFLVVAHEQGLWFGEIIAETNYGFHDHDEKPYRTSSSMPARLARGMVNLAYPARRILDPCCGTGTIVIEACSMGLEAIGVDKNPKMVGMSRRNLRHFGLEACVERGDARECAHPAEAVVTDLPYGIMLEASAQIPEILRRSAELAPVGIFLAAEDITPALNDAGYTLVRVFGIQKRKGMSRFVHRAEKGG
jgi:tRNA G10  N-methylase Trm11